MSDLKKKPSSTELTNFYRGARSVNYPRIANDLATRGVTEKSLSAGCIAAGTEISTTDGFTLIEDVCAGDRILGNISVPYLTVTGAWIGIEELPMIALTTRMGHTILVTGNQPMLTPNGQCLARNLTVGNNVLTDTGTDTIIKVEQTKYDGMVHTLDLGTETELSHARGSGLTMIAAGFIVGNVTQKLNLVLIDSLRPVNLA